MVFVKFRNTNNASSTLIADISASATALLIKDWDQSLFPTNFPFLLTLEHLDPDENVILREIVKVTWSNQNSFTVERSAGVCVQDDTASNRSQDNTAHAFYSWDKVSLYWTAEQVRDIQERLETSVNDPAIADEYDNTATYAVWDIVMYKGDRYSCSTAVSTPEDFDSTKWTKVGVQHDLDYMQSEIDYLMAWSGATSDHLEDRGLVWTNYDINTDKLFRQLTPTYENATNAVNIGDINDDKEIHIQRQGSGTQSNKLKLKIKLWWSPTTSLIVEVRKWVSVIDSDTWESYWYGDSNNVLATATLPYTDFDSNRKDVEITLNNSFGWTEGELLDIVLYQTSHTVNASNYYIIGIDSTQKSDAFQCIRVNGTTYKRTQLMPYCISDWFANIMMERVTTSGAYALPRVQATLGEITRVTTYGRHIDGIWLDHNSESTIEYISSRYLTMTMYIDESKSDPSQMITYGDDATDMTAGSSDWDDFFGYRPCLLDASGQVYKYLNPLDYTKDIDWNDVSNYVTGTDGTYNVMVEFPRRGFKMSKSWSIITVSITDNPADYANGFHYYAHTRWPVDLSQDDTSADEMQYAKDYFYLGAYKGYVQDSKLRSISGKIPTTTIYIYDARTNARANWTGYEQSGFYQLEIRKAYYAMKYKNMNSQATLGRGFVDKTSGWSSTSCQTWATNSRWLDYWVTSTGTDISVNRVKFAWIEDPRGNVWEWIDWINLNNYHAYASCDCDTWLHDKTDWNYHDVWTLPSTSDSYIKTVLWTTKGGFLPASVGGSDSTYYCDNYRVNSGARVVGSGASWDVASEAGAFVMSLNRASSARYAYVGARLMFL